MILVTGGTGLVGSHLMYDLLKQGFEIRAIKRTNSNLDNAKKVFSYYSNNPEELFQRIEWVEGDILDYISITNALEGIDKVYHCAAIVSFDPNDKEKIIKHNVNGTANVVNACLEKKIKKLCHVSSIAALGRATTEGIVKEDTQWMPSAKNSTYSISKYESEREVWRGTAEGLNAVIVNPSIILGPGNWDTGSAKLFKTVYDGLKFYTKGVNGFVDVKDVSKSMISLMESGIKNEGYILSATELSYEYLFKQIAKELNIKGPTIYANKFLSGLAWRYEKIKSLITGNPPFITRENASSARQKYYYSNEKIIKAIDFQFRNINDSITEYALYLSKESE